MLPEIARQVLETYSQLDDLIVDPMCGIGTTLVEAVHLGRRAIGVELEDRWATLARANLKHARDRGATGRGRVICGDARQLTRLLARRSADLLLTSPPGQNATLGDPRAGHGIERTRGCESRRITATARAHAKRLERSCHDGQHPGNVAALPYQRADLVLTSPPYACDIGEPQAAAWGTGHDLCPREQRNYSRSEDNLGHARGDSYLAAMGEIYAVCERVLKPGGFLVLVTKDMRADGALRNLAGDTITLCERTGLAYWQHVIALLATISEDRLIPRPSFWQRVQIRKAIERGEHAQLVGHEDVLVFRKPSRPESTTTATQRAA